MLSAVAWVPSAPVMVPELAAGAASELAELRTAVVAAAAELPDRWIAVGVGDADGVIPPSAVGTFGGYGADLPVALAPEPTGAATRLPLCALITGWIRGCVNPAARAEVRVFAAALDATAAGDAGRALRAEIDAAPEPIGVLVVADGANTLTPPAPGGYDPESVAVQEALDAALAAGDDAVLAALPDGIVGRAAYQVFAGLAAPGAVRELYRDAPYGVGYSVGVRAIGP
ncbi:class III extradiol ring-cleavage dioxygenase family protein [Mycolicibacterium arenosum]|uniref:Uncharacterized protein n=1 Tax=Mycolicibacterium arenosum TaxID=2952157 RepID=A0ABT1M3V1_9MYCO|nr:hypothetical protein [Mycolicibacterium sp. CAU 1645]MCP9273107.1 hypothetical protein [Mycolicibacterium sp. CAU 1645]